MTGYEELITRIRDRADVGSNESAEQAAGAAVATVTGCLTEAETEQLAGALPRRLRDAVRFAARVDQIIDAAPYISR